MAIPHIIFSQSRKNDVSQLVQGLTQKQRVDHCLALAVVQIQAVYAFALDQKGHDPALVLFDSDTGQLGAVAQEKSAPEDIRSLNRGYHAISPPSLSAVGPAKADYLAPAYLLSEAGRL
jgi:hypothetical protein